ncbi:MAG: hypothetical protein HYT79_06600 [Elusimicrobia bacterium]|nr:hypothetical protein [Elusimicrobiota bacterium]
MIIRSDPPAYAAANMAADRALFEQIKRGQSEPVIRLYKWKETSITIGFSLSADHPLVTQFGIAAVKRPTGGGLVIHRPEGEVTVCVTAERPHRRSINEIYLAIHEPLAWALNKLGFPVELSMQCPPKSPPAALPSCFDDPPSLYDGLINGRKILGGGLRLAGDCFIYQGTIKIAGLQQETLAQTLRSCPLLAENIFLQKAKQVESYSAQRCAPGIGANQVQSPGL